MSSPSAKGPSRRRDDILPFEVQQAFWGYVIRGTEGPPILVQVAQGLVLSTGAACAAASLAVASLTPEDVAGMSILRFGASAILMALALLFLRYATRGGVVELHVDLARGELREVVRHRIGRASTLGAHGFDPMASLHIQRDGPGRLRTLVLHHRGDREGLCIARGPEHALQALRRRLEHDIRVHAPGRPVPARALAA
jgi:hypothetical protein